MRFSPDGKYIAVGGGDHVVKVFSVEEGEAGGSAAGTGGSATPVAAGESSVVRAEGPGITENRPRLTAFYTKYNPENLHKVESILIRYEGRFDELFARLEAKYPGSKATLEPEAAGAGTGAAGGAASPAPAASPARPAAAAAAASASASASPSRSLSGKIPSFSRSTTEAAARSRATLRWAGESTEAA